MDYEFIKLQFICEFIFCSFLSTGGKKRTKETPHREKRVLKNQTQQAAFDFTSTPSLPYEPHSPVGFADDAFANFNLVVVEFCSKINALAGFNTLSSGIDREGFF